MLDVKTLVSEGVPSEFHSELVQASIGHGEVIRELLALAKIYGPSVFKLVGPIMTFIAQNPGANWLTIVAFVATLLGKVTPVPTK